jgi:hypothetical protein
MTQRAELLRELVREILGPRDGPEEELASSNDPIDEFVTGVLAPATTSRPADDVDSDSDRIVEGEADEEDLEDEGDAASAGAVSPALDPKARPKSIGLSFVIAPSAGESAAIDICATWGRYDRTDVGWKRRPCHLLTGIADASVDRSWTNDDVRVEIHSKPLAGGAWRVSVFLTNRVVPEREDRAATDECVFQPQIRVLLAGSCRLLPFEESSSEPRDDEDAQLAFLYRGRNGFARGHLCGAFWSAVDPNRPRAGSDEMGPRPFHWFDGEHLDPGDRARFELPDVRTDFIPAYPIEAPTIEWDTDIGPAPELSAETLSARWRPGELRDALQPLVDGYRRWIALKQAEVARAEAEINETDRGFANANLDACRECADRMQDAIEILATDEEARLAFCFANKAISMQARWARPSEPNGLTWRPFQIAFLLLNIPAIADPTRDDRALMDLLWFPTGGGKTEAYLGLTAFTMALRRRRAASAGRRDLGGGTVVLSRYTLRLLTVQQFRRALGLVTACEVLRVWNLDAPDEPVGWRPGDCSIDEDFLWGSMRFAVGVWVGSSVTPNGLLSYGPVPTSTGLVVFAGAIDQLQGAGGRYVGPTPSLVRGGFRVSTDGEPAQVTKCPCCRTTLALAREGLGPGDYELHFVIRGIPHFAGTGPTSPGAAILVTGWRYTPAAGDYGTLTVALRIGPGEMKPEVLDSWWYDTVLTEGGGGLILQAARPSRLGYFITSYRTAQGTRPQSDFEIFCPNPACELNGQAWAEQVPVSRDETRTGGVRGHVATRFAATEAFSELPLFDGMQWQEIPEAFRAPTADHTRVSMRIPIPALTVDDQLYHRCPSVVIATADKLARLSFEPKAASLFGNVSHFHSRWGYYRAGIPPSWGDRPTVPREHPPGNSGASPLHVAVPPFDPPDLVLQDELHLIEGPLGSLVGLYETAVDTLATNPRGGIKPKYIASSATIRAADTQVAAVFDREMRLFPPTALDAEDRFFAKSSESHPMDESRPGRLYVGVAAPGRGAQTPLIRIWSALLQGSILSVPAPDQFWTLVGYFNAVRELAGARALYRQDIPERMRHTAGSNARDLDEGTELSSRANSLQLPALLESLANAAPNAPDAVFATSMFGTGVDIDRLGLMVVNGQPKTTSAYIQATGRVGRQIGGLVVAFYRASRPRDLDHYEYFSGYHRALYRYVEPVTVSPFAPRARERALGPVAAALLRNAREILGRPVDPGWAIEQRLSGDNFQSLASMMASGRADAAVVAVARLLEQRAAAQPTGRRPPAGLTQREAESELDRWQAIAAQHPGPDNFVYWEPSMMRTPHRHVVLGDDQHEAQGLEQAFESAPQSLRDVESTTGFRT